MIWITFRCDCGCPFAIPKVDVPDEPSCPNCGTEYGVDATGECINDPEIEPLRGDI